MTDLPLGLYEQLITEDLDRRLRGVDPFLVDRDTLDPVDAHEVLARHVGRLARRALRAAGGDGPDALARQVQPPSEPHPAQFGSRADRRSP